MATIPQTQIDMAGWGTLCFDSKDQLVYSPYLMMSPENDGGLLLSGLEDQLPIMEGGCGEFFHHYDMTLMGPGLDMVLPDWSMPLENFPNLLVSSDEAFYPYAASPPPPPTAANSCLFAPYHPNTQPPTFPMMAPPPPPPPMYLPSDDILQMMFDSASDEKPPYSYSQLITRAILESPAHQLLLSEIYDWMMDRFPYFRFDRAGVWKNSVRHNLSVNKAFTRAPRHQAQPGKGSYWTLDQQYLSRMDKRNQRRKLHASSSPANSARQAQ